MGYASVFTKQKTSLKKECHGENCLASEFDNIWYKSSKIEIQSSKALLFYTSFDSLDDARAISDHIPITATLKFLD